MSGAHTAQQLDRAGCAQYNPIFGQKIDQRPLPITENKLLTSYLAGKIIFLSKMKH